MWRGGTDPGAEEARPVPRQFMKVQTVTARGASPDLLPVHLHLPAAPQRRPGRVVVVVDHTANVVHQLVAVRYLGCSAGVVDVALALSGPEVTVKPPTVPVTVGLNRSLSLISYQATPSLYVSFPEGHEVDSEDVLQGEPSGVELIENKAPAIRAENFVVEINHDLVPRSVDRDLQIMDRISILTAVINGLNVTGQPKGSDHHIT